MNNIEHKKEMVNEFTNRLKSKNKLRYAWISLLVLMIGFGIFAFVYTEIHGHVVTGMRDNVVWGIYIANFIFCNLY